MTLGMVIRSAGRSANAAAKSVNDYVLLFYKSLIFILIILIYLHMFSVHTYKLF